MDYPALLIYDQLNGKTKQQRKKSQTGVEKQTDSKINFISWTQGFFFIS